MRIVFLLLFAIISASTDKIKHVTFVSETLFNRTEFESNEPNTKTDETTLKTANSGASTESTINWQYTNLISNEKSTSSFTNKVENAKDIQIATIFPETNSDLQVEETANIESTTKIYAPTTNKINTPTNKLNIKTENVTNSEYKTGNKNLERNEENVTNTTNTDVRIEQTTKIYSTTNLWTHLSNIQSANISNNEIQINSKNLEENKDSVTNIPETNTDFSVERATKIVSTTVSTTLPNIQSENVLNNKNERNSKNLGRNKEDITSSPETNTDFPAKILNIESTTKVYASSPNNSSTNIQSTIRTHEKIISENADENIVRNSPETNNDFKSTKKLESSTNKSIINEADSSTNIPSKKVKSNKNLGQTTEPTEDNYVPISEKPTESSVEQLTTILDQYYNGKYLVNIISKKENIPDETTCLENCTYPSELPRSSKLREETLTSSIIPSPISTTSLELPLSSTDLPTSENTSETVQETTEDEPTSENTSETIKETTEEIIDTSTEGFTNTESTTEDTSSIATTTTTPTTTTSTTTTTTEAPNPCLENRQIEVEIVIPSHFSVYLNWSDPLPLCNFTYDIKLSTKLKYRKLYYGAEINTTEYTIENLHACEDYTISIYTKYLDNPVNSPIEISTRTLDYMLPVENVTNIRNKMSKFYENLTVSWILPRNVQKCLKRYIIEIYKDGHRQETIDRTNNFITFYNISSCINNTYLISSHSAQMNAAPKSTTYLDPELNDPPIYIPLQTEISNDFVITKWNFGSFICRPEIFKVECKTEDEEPITIIGEMYLQNKSLSAKIDNVEPYTNYSCCGIIQNKKGDSKCSEPGVFLTKSKAPGKPLNINISQSEETLEIQWDPPTKWNGVEDRYKIRIEFVKFNYFFPKGCPEEETFSPFYKELFETQINFNDMIPGSKYKISVQAKSDGGWGEYEIQEVNIREAVPEAPQGLKAQIIQSTASKDHYSAFFNLTWDVFCKMYGELTKFNLKVYVQKGNYSELVDERNFPEQNSFKSDPYLKPEHNYIIQLRAINNEYDGQISKITFMAPAGIPSPPNIDNLKKPDTSVAPEPWNSAVVYISKNIFDDTNGEIKYVSIIVAEPGCEEKPRNEYYNGENWPKVASDNSTCIDEFRAYEATEPKWDPFFQPTKSSEDIQYILGENQSCTVLDCNRPLKSSTTYWIKLRVFTTHGYQDTTEYLYIKTEAFSDIPVGLIVGLIIGILVIAFLIAAVLFYTKGKLNFKNWPRMESTNQISPAPLPVPIKKFGSHYEKMIENPGKIKNEFQLLSTISSDVTLSTKTALLPVNKKKNRYINILPYDQTRVQLADTNENSSDYINASYIRGYSGSHEYIATQGPTEATCPAFWQMIIEQNVKLIVMLTQFVETGKDKCYKYFPELKEEYDFLNDIKVQCTEEEILNVYNKRVFKVKKGSTIKKVTHMQFNLWPDFGVPDEVCNMLEFCETIKEIKLKKPSIIVMHCSAGVGRTGTLIAVDILLQNIRDKRKVDIFGTVLNLRKQRMNMVQSERQYEYLYKCLYHVITNKLNNTTSSKHNLNQISESNML